MTSIEALNSVAIVLVGTSHPGNIGAVARAMKVMGLRDLRLVGPKRFPHPQAFWRSKNAQDIVENAKVFDALEHAVAEHNFIIGTSARQRNLPWPLKTAENAVAEALTKLDNHKLAVIFGPEDSGLSNHDLQLCNLHLTIPTGDEYSSLNLAQAVQVVAYEFVRQLPQKTFINDKNQPMATLEQRESFFQHLQHVLEKIDFYKTRDTQQLDSRLKRLFVKAQMEESEINIMRGVLSAVEKASQK